MLRKTPLLAALLLLGAPLLTACERPSQTTAPASTSASGATTPTVLASAAETTAPSALPVAPKPNEHALSREAFASLIDRISEPDADFFSDNYISNETSYLQVAPTLKSRAAAGITGGAYVGVGPEQNFTYIALMKPDMAYIVDIRRENLLLQLLYKAAFERASSRAQFLELLTGREPTPEPATDATAEPSADNIPLDQVLARVDARPATEETFRAVHEALLKHIGEVSGIELDEKDRRSLERSHRAFFKDGLDIRFSLKEESFRKYPSLRELVLEKDDAGEQSGFLATGDAFRFVQQMQRENRIVPLVGDFAGDRAMPALAAYVHEHHQVLRGFYVSNVEQYLMVDGKWWKWQRNVAAFPSDDDSLFIRCYLNQGKPHPSQWAGHRTTTTLHPIADFNARKKPYPSMLALATDNQLPRP